MPTISITKEQMIRDINSDLCGTVEAWTCSGELNFDSSKIKIFTRWWKHPGVGDYTKVTETGQCHLGFPGVLYTWGYHHHESSKCHPWLQEQEDKYPGFIEKVWLNIKGI